MPGREVTIVLVPGLDQHIYNLGAALFGEDCRNDSVEEVISLLLPELVKNALAGDMLLEEPPVLSDETSSERIEDIAQAVEEAEHKASTPQVAEEELKVMPADPVKEDEMKVPTFDELCRMAEINSAAVQWAKGNPGKEQALVETCISMPANMWSWNKVLELAERTWNMRGGDRE